MCVLQGRKMANVEMSMNFLKTSKFMSKVAPFSIHTELFPVECATVLGLVLIIGLLGLLREVQVVILAQFI